MKRGQFFSLASLFLILGLLTIYFTLVDKVKEDEQFRVERAQHSLFKNVASNLHRLDIPHALRTSARFALTHYTDQQGTVNYTELASVMRNGSHKGTQYISEDLTTTAQIQRVTTTFPALRDDDISVNYSLIGADQERHRAIQLSFNVSYELHGQQAIIRNHDIYNISIRAESITHPKYNAPILPTWEKNSTDCLVTDIFADNAPSINCNGYNLNPP